MNVVFEDHTPIWKLISISIISGLGLIYPYFKNSKEFDLQKVSRFQKRKIEHNEIDLDFLKDILASKNIFQKKISVNNYIFSNKANWKDLGKIYKLKKLDNGVSFKVYPKFCLGIIDGGETYKEVNSIVEEIRKYK